MNRLMRARTTGSVGGTSEQFGAHLLTHSPIGQRLLKIVQVNGNLGYELPPPGDIRSAPREPPIAEPHQNLPHHRIVRPSHVDFICDACHCCYCFGFSPANAKHVMRKPTKHPPPAAGTVWFALDRYPAIMPITLNTAGPRIQNVLFVICSSNHR
jgi:hypothetical protein